MNILRWLDKNRALAAIGVLGLVVLGGLIQAQTNYLGTVFIADSTTPSQQLAVTAAGEAKVDCTTGCSGGGGGTSNVNLIQVGGSAIAIGQAAMAASLPVVIASNQSSIPVASTLQAGSALIGKAGIDQTTPGTTNGVSVVPTSNSTVGIAPAATSALASNQVAKGSAGNLYGFSGNSTAAGYFLVFNATSAPGDGAVTPAECYGYPVPNQPFGVSFGNFPAVFSTGITIVFSTTGCFTKTASTTAFISSQVE